MHGHSWCSQVLLAMLFPLCLASFGYGEGKDLLFFWEFPADAQPPAESFLFTYWGSDRPETTRQFRIPNQGTASCDGVASVVPERTANTICGRPPDCLAAGLYLFAVQAEMGEAKSASTAPVTCAALPDCLYDCEVTQLPAPVQKLVDAAYTTGKPPSPEALAALIKNVTAAAPVNLPEVPSPPLTPSQIIGAGSQVLDQVAQALAKLPASPV